MRMIPPFHLIEKALQFRRFHEMRVFRPRGLAGL